MTAGSAGSYRAVKCVRSALRRRSARNVPTFAEQGVSGQEADTLTGIVAPVGTPNGIV